MSALMKARLRHPRCLSCLILYVCLLSIAIFVNWLHISGCHTPDNSFRIVLDFPDSTSSTLAPIVPLPIVPFITSTLAGEA